MKHYYPQEIESKWQKKWEESGLYEPDLDMAERPYYNLMMFPYSSAEGLHVGNMYAFTGSDMYGRFKRMQGFDVFEPIGLDGFGINSENYALKVGKHPAKLAKITQENFYSQLRATGNAYAWKHALETYDPNYYRWTQWIFIQMFKRGLVYRGKALVNWCPKCLTVLADEQVIAGACERCSTQVIRKELEQWFFKITAYADRLLKNLEKIDWSEKVKIAQRNWIGRAEDVEIVFSLVNFDLKITILTTRPDTIFGVTFLVLAPEHELIQKLKEKIQNWDEVQRYIEKARQKSDFERGMVKDKTGAKLEGITAVNPASGQEIPVYTADFVLGTYGTGAIMGVPAHDDRDFAFAKKFNLPIVEVVKRLEKEDIIRVYIYDDDLSDVAQSLRDLGQAAEYWTPTQRQYNIQFQDAEKVSAILKKAAIGAPEQHEFIKRGEAFALEMEPASIDFGMVYSGDGVHVNSGFLNGLEEPLIMEPSEMVVVPLPILMLVEK